MVDRSPTALPLSDRSEAFLAAIHDRVVIYDGAMGTGVQRRNLTPDDFGGDDLEGCNEYLVITRPDVIADLHRGFLDIGCDVIETDTFGGLAMTLAEYGLEDRADELNTAAARLAREVADEFSTPERPRWVAGSMGPGTKFPSLGQVRYDEMKDGFEQQARALLEGGVDLLIIETMFDLLTIKAAMNGSRQAMATVGRQVPLQVQVTIELTGRMLPGTEIQAALAAIEPLGPDVFGLNCATGPAEMYEHIRVLSQNSSVPISVIPNAGLPSVVDGEMHYDLTEDQLAEHLAGFVTDLGANIIGGCCGTGPEHLQAVIDRCAELKPAERTPTRLSGATSIYSFVPFEQDTSFLIIGERTNANGSKKFREAMLSGDTETVDKMGKDQIAEGAHVLDVCVDYVGRDGTIDMDETAKRFATGVSAPLVLDSTEPQVMEAGLKWLGGRAILNSANLEDGEGEGSRFDRVMRLAKEYGAAVVCLLIDEEGQARDVEWKMRIAHRIHDLAVNRYGLTSGDLIFDALTFPLSTGDDDLRRDGIATMDAIKRIKEELPGTFTTLGLSNISFGLNPAARQVLNSVFLHECLAIGLDSAIIHAGRILPLSKIDDERMTATLDLIYDRRGTAGGDGTDDKYDPLVKLLDLFADATAIKAEVVDKSGWSVDRRLHQRIIDGDRDGLSDDLDEALETMKALEIVNDHLLGGMKVVGELFGAGEMQLPFVLQSAETMKAAVAYLEPHMERIDGEDSSKGRVVLATVKGDVHDIGKNLVDIILTNNGYEVHNLGIKISITEMIDKAKEIGADAIGMSGLLVKSTLIMRDNLEELNRRELSDIPILLGGAALTRSYVERDLREVYDGRVFYGKDAFEGMHTLDKLGEMKASGIDDPDFGTVPAGLMLENFRTPKEAVDPSTLPHRSPEIATDNEVFTPPFLGSRIVKGLSVDEIATWINETALFRHQWQFRPQDGENDAEFKERIRPLFRQQLADAKAAGILNPAVVYGYFPANSDGNDVIIWTDDTRTVERARFSYPRQSEEPHKCIADFFRPVGHDGAKTEADYAAFHIVTMGRTVSDVAAELFAADKYQDYLFLHGIGVEMAEALAEMWHARIRAEWGFGNEDGDGLLGLFRQKFRGGRYSWGYPACPDLEDNALVAELLEASRIDVECNEDTAWQYQPEQTTSAVICHHPQAKYFVAR